MPHVVAWLLIALGVAHTLFGLVRFKHPLLDAMSDGFIGQFKKTESRSAAFWFVIFGPLLAMGGHIALHAVAVGDGTLLTIIGVYVMVVSAIGTAAFPRSPFPLGLALSILVIVAGRAMSN
jgi:hypothetical protein